MKVKKSTTKIAPITVAATKKKSETNSIDQATIAQKIQDSLFDEGINLNLNVIQKVIAAEQETCKKLLASGAKIVKWNYLTLYTSTMPARKLTCPKNGLDYDIPENVRVNVRVGEGLKRAVQTLAANSSPVGKKVPAPPRKQTDRTRLYGDRFVQEGLSVGKKQAEG